jgi:putative flippase GtrA
MKDKIYNQIYDIYRDRKVTAKFIVIGSIGFICNYSVLKLGTAVLDLNRIVAEILAVAVALQVTFILHDRWTYRIDETIHKYHLNFPQRYRMYIMSNSFSSLLIVVTFAIASIFLGHLISLALASMVGLTWNFLVNKNIIWHHKAHDGKPAE